MRCFAYRQTKAITLMPAFQRWAIINVTAQRKLITLIFYEPERLGVELDWSEVVKWNGFATRSMSLQHIQRWGSVQNMNREQSFVLLCVLFEGLSFSVKLTFSPGCNFLILFFYIRWLLWQLKCTACVRFTFYLKVSLSDITLSWFFSVIPCHVI